jgi:enoyl-CoA hydratase
MDMVSVETDARGVATVTVRRAAKLNTLDPPTMAALIGAMARVSENDALRAVILTGEGERAFIGGADIGAMATLDTSSARDFITNVHRVCASMRDCPVPVIARIRGWALGAGLEVAAACDIRIAAEDAKFGMPEVRIGIPSVVEAALLPGLIGWGKTRRLLLTGETINAAEAERWGLVERVVRSDRLDAAVEAAVGGILAGGPAAIRDQKRLIRAWEDLPLSAAIEAGIDSFAASFRTDEPTRLMADFLAAMQARKAGGR